VIDFTFRSLLTNVAMWWLGRRGTEIWRKPDAKVEMTVREAPRIIDSSKLTYEQRQQFWQRPKRKRVSFCRKTKSIADDQEPKTGQRKRQRSSLHLRPADSHCCSAL